MGHRIVKKIFIFVLLCIQSQYCQSFFFQKQTTVSSAQSAAQEKIKNIVIECMEKEKSDPIHVYALFAINSQNSQAKCVLLCVMHNCNLMDKDGNYDKQKIEIIMNRTEPNKPQSKFSFFGRNKAKDNETLKECIEKDFKADACDKAYIFTKCLQKQTKKSFNTLTGDLFDQASEDNGAFNIGSDNLQSAASEDNNMTEIGTTETTTIINTLAAIDFNTNLLEMNNNESTSETVYDILATTTFENTTMEENIGSTSETLYNISSMTTTSENTTMEENIGSTSETLYNISSTTTMPDNVTMEENIESATETLYNNSSLIMFNETTIIEETSAPVILQNSTETISFNTTVNESKDSLPKTYSL